MVEVEIRAPRHNEEAQTIEWEQVALVRADSDGIKVWGDASCVTDDSVVDVVSGSRVDMSCNPEEWARNLPYAYRSGDLVAAILHDDHPADVESCDPIDEPMIPDPPVPEASSDPTGRVVRA